MIAVRPKINSALSIAGCHVIPNVHFEINTPSFEGQEKQTRKKMARTVKLHEARENAVRAFSKGQLIPMLFS